MREHGSVSVVIADLDGHHGRTEPGHSTFWFPRKQRHGAVRRWLLFPIGYKAVNCAQPG